MVSLKLKQAITKMLAEPGSMSYETAKAILNDRPVTLWDAVVDAGLSDAMTWNEKAETYWICSAMPDEVGDTIMQRMRIALNVGLVVAVEWNEGDFGLVVSQSGAGITLYVSTPVPDLSKLQPGSFAGAIACA